MNNMKKWTVALTTTIALAMLPACDKSKEAGAPAAQGADDHHAHAPHDYEPGTHEDWCGEHQVPESMCTRCNSSLVPGFKATGDWCEEHGMPESQCLACNPDLKIERPPKEESK